MHALRYGHVRWMLASALALALRMAANAEAEPFRDGDQVEFVQDAIVLENLISKYLFSQAGNRDEAPADAAPAAQE